MFLLAEGAWRAARHVKRILTADDASPTADIFDRQPWGARYKSDLEGYDWPSTFEPLVDFRARAWRSESVNVADDGTRWTPHNGEPGGAPALRVLCFGGSTMLGVGVPDWGTIPAYLSLAFKERGLPHEVVNHGTGWWTSSQSLARLAGLLRAGQRPDVVVFYDGINDVNVVSFGGSVGGISPEAEALLERGLENKPRLLQDLISKSALLGGLLSRLHPNWRQKGPKGHFSLTAPEMERYAGEIVRAYESNVRMAGALAREYGFSTHFFLQPYPMIARKPLTETDRLATEPRRRFRTEEEKLFAMVYERLRASDYLRGRGDFHDLQDLFAAEERPLYIDSEHLLPLGNEIVARAIFEVVSREKPRSRP